jgi:hypothetical protein
MKSYKRSVFVVAMLIFSSLGSKAQILHPIKWSYGVQNKGKDLRTILIRATIDSGWHIYSVDQQPGGPERTSIEFAPTDQFVLDGALSQPRPLLKFDKTFHMQVSYFENTAIFKQQIKLTKAKAVVRGTIHFMTCNDQKCLAPEDVELAICIK